MTDLSDGALTTGYRALSAFIPKVQSAIKQVSTPVTIMGADGKPQIVIPVTDDKGTTTLNPVGASAEPTYQQKMEMEAFKARQKAQEDQRIREQDPLYRAQLEEKQTKKSTAEAKAEMKKREAVAKATNIIGKAEQALSKVGWNTAGFIGTKIDFAGTPGADLQGLIDTIQANLGFEELAAMREASPTGGALGAVTERELSLLQSASASLERKQSPEQLRGHLQEVITRFTKVRGLLTGELTVPESQADFDALPSGATYVDPDDGTLYRKP